MSEQQGVQGSTAAAGAPPPLFVQVGDDLINFSRVLEVSGATGGGVPCTIIAYDNGREHVYYRDDALAVVAAARRLADAGRAGQGVPS